MDWLISESLETRLGVQNKEGLSVIIEGVTGTLVSVKLNKSPKIAFITEDVVGGLELLNKSPSSAIIKYSAFEYIFTVPKTSATLVIERIGEKLRITLGTEIEK